MKKAWCVRALVLVAVGMLCAGGSWALPPAVEIISTDGKPALTLNGVDILAGTPAAVMQLVSADGKERGLTIKGQLAPNPHGMGWCIDSPELKLTCEVSATGPVVTCVLTIDNAGREHLLPATRIDLLGMRLQGLQWLPAGRTGARIEVPAMDGNFGIWYHFLPDTVIVEYAANTATEPALLVALSAAVKGVTQLEALEDRHLQGHARHEGWVIGTQGLQLVTGLPTTVAIQGITPQWVTDWMRQPVQGVRLAFPMKKRVAMEIQIGPAAATAKP
jgi:hypothetical protein